jgi:hypothetical protein
MAAGPGPGPRRAAIAVWVVAYFRDFFPTHSFAECRVDFNPDEIKKLVL